MEEAIIVVAFQVATTACDEARTRGLARSRSFAQPRGLTMVLDSGEKRETSMAAWIYHRTREVGS